MATPRLAGTAVLDAGVGVGYLFLTVPPAMDSPPPPPMSVARVTPATYVWLSVAVVVLVGAGIAVGQAGVPMVGGIRGYPRVPGPPPDVRTLLRQLGVGSVAWYATALSLPVLWPVAAAFPLTQSRAWRSLGVQVALVAVLVGVAAWAQYAITFRGAPSVPPFSAYAQIAIGANALPLLAVATMANVVEARRRAVRGSLEAGRLRAELAESRLVAVTSQLQPHFLFNTLQSISTLIHRDPAAADAMLAKLSDLLRDVLRRSRRALVPFADELRMAETYLDLARIRYAERLRTTVDVPAEAARAEVPVLLLQPFIENALRHGIGPRAAGGEVGIAARVDGGRLVVTVWDDGVGLAAATTEGTGIANARERLRHAYGDAQSLDVAPRAAGGVTVTIAMPLRWAAE
ncbi:MAG TPA: histidine kinase [Gemmatimonadaceae bacterium]|nr:histidine kinase [Gemmatimonadaceae bacterium]